jgi:hypothetical protein
VTGVLEKDRRHRRDVEDRRDDQKRHDRKPPDRSCGGGEKAGDVLIGQGALVREAERDGQKERDDREQDRRRRQPDEQMDQQEWQPEAQGLGIAVQGFAQQGRSVLRSGRSV